MKRLNVKTINQSIKMAKNSDYFNRLNKLYNTIPQGKCGECAKCCTESVHTYFVEFLNIWNFLQENKILMDQLLPKIVRFYFLELVRNTHCPFLNDDHNCSIYSFRPMVCRSFGHWSQEEYEEGYRNVLRDNKQSAKLFKNSYGVKLPEEVVNRKIEYCDSFEVHKRIVRAQRQTLADSLLNMESGFFMRGLITEEYMNTGLVSWFIYTLMDMDEAGERRVQIMKEYLDGGYSETLEGIVEKL